MNQTVLSWSGIVFGDVGGDQLDIGNLGAITAYDDSVPGTVYFSEISLDDPSTLDSDQLGAFRLAQFTFTGLSSGISLLELPSITLLDALGDPIEFDTAAIPLSIQVTAVPVPAAAWLFGSALAAVGVLRRRATEFLRHKV